MVGKYINKTKSNKKKSCRQVIAPKSGNRTRRTTSAPFGPVSRCVELCREQREQTPPRAVRADLGRFPTTCGGQYRAPAEAQRSGFGGKRRSSEMSEFSPIWGGNEGYGAGDDVKRDKEQASSVTPCSVTSARSAGSYGGLRGVPKWGQNRRGAITSAVVILESLLPHKKSRGHAPERSSF